MPFGEVGGGVPPPEINTISLGSSLLWIVDRARKHQSFLICCEKLDSNQLEYCHRSVSALKRRELFKCGKFPSRLPSLDSARRQSCIHESRHHFNKSLIILV